ncbi:MAG: MlaD family protein [Thermoanaerobaculia bacterium]
MRRILALLLLAGIAVGVWYGARWIRHRDDLRATLVFDHAGDLRRGDPVEVRGVRIGTVTGIARLENQDAVSIRVDHQHRNQILSDSLFTIEGSRPGPSRLEVHNILSVGKPVESGAVIRVRSDRLTRWLAKNGEKVAPVFAELGQKAKQLVDQYESGELKKQMDEWRREYPEWKREGRAAAEKHLDEIRRKIDQVEAELRKEDRKAEAEKLRQQFQEWMQKLRQDDAESGAEN